MAVVPRVRPGVRGGVVVEGADVVAAQFMRAADQVNARLRTAGRPVADAIGETQRSLVPVRSGRTHDSIEVTANPDVGVDQTGREALYEIGPTWFVARFLEYGTYKMGPQPFVGPSADMHADEWASVARDVAGDI